MANVVAKVTGARKGVLFDGMLDDDVCSRVLTAIARGDELATKRGTVQGEAIEGRGVISTQFIRTPSGWRMSSMAWDDERPGLAIPARYR